MTRTFLALLLLGFTLTTTSLYAAHDSVKTVVMPIEPANKSLSEGVKVIQDIIIDYFKDNHSVTVLSEEQKEALTGEKSGSRQDIIRTVTEKMDGKQALVISLTRYRERVGDEYSVEDPASLAFEFKLINIENGKTICSGRYDETQEPLSENVLNLGQAIKRGFKWVSVRKMATEAVREKLSACPALKEAP